MNHTSLLHSSKEVTSMAGGRFYQSLGRVQPQFYQATPEHNSANNATRTPFAWESWWEFLFNQKGQCSDRRSSGRRTINKNQQTSKRNLNHRGDPVARFQPRFLGIRICFLALLKLPYHEFQVLRRYLVELISYQIPLDSSNPLIINSYWSYQKQNETLQMFKVVSISFWCWLVMVKHSYINVT